MTRSGIPTLYAGTWFRSRLEAKWAAFFDLVRWSWTYEPIDSPGYIPDFLIHGERPFFVEVGPLVTLPDYADKATKPDRSVESLGRDLLLVGVQPLAPFVSETVGRVENPAAGWFGEYNGPEGLVWDAGLWGHCADCGAIGVVHSQMTYSLRPCGHHQSGGFGEPLDPEWLTALWRRVSNDTQWSARKPQPLSSILRAMQ